MLALTPLTLFGGLSCEGHALNARRPLRKTLMNKNEDVKAAATAAAQLILKPFAALLVQAHVGIGEFEQLARLAYIEAAKQLPGNVRLDGTANVARIAYATGLSRAEVTSLVTEGVATDKSAAGLGRQRGERVLSGWHNDPDFQDPRSGGPAVLPVSGREPSFVALVKRYSGETPAVTVLTALEAAGAVERLPDNRVKALSRTSISGHWAQDTLESLGEQVAELFELLLHNTRALDEKSKRLAGTVENLHVHPRQFPVLLGHIQDHLKAFLRSTDRQLNHPHNTASGKQAAGRIRVGFYLTHEGPEPAAGDTRRKPTRGTSPRRSRAARRPSRSPTDLKTGR